MLCAIFLSKITILVWFNLLVDILINSFWYQGCYTKCCDEYCKIFDKNSKNRNDSGDSNPEGERKKITNGSSASSTGNCKGFKKVLESPEFKNIFFNLFKYL